MSLDHEGALTGDLFSLSGLLLRGLGCLLLNNFLWDQVVTNRIRSILWIDFDFFLRIENRLVNFFD